MPILNGIAYDPATTANVSCGSLLALTAMDTGNLRLNFTVPANGCVLVRLRFNETGATTFPQVLLGVLQATTKIGRVSPIGSINGTAVASTQVVQEAMFAVSGLTPNASLTWDAAYAVQVLLASTALRWGGPNNTTTNDAFGAAVFEVWTAPNLLGVKLYDPAVAVSKATTSLLAMTALDTTNLRIAFTVPDSGAVFVRLNGTLHGATTFPQVVLGILQSATVKFRAAPIGGLRATALATTQLAIESSGLVTGLTPGAALTWDAAYGVEVVVASTGLKYGGPNDTTGNDAFGGFLFEVWAA